MIALALLCGRAGAQAARYEITAPAAAGGGWDRTARAMQAAMRDAKIASDVAVVNIPGAGGTIGLAQFAAEKEGDPSALIVGGDAMVGAILADRSTVTLDQVTPIARLAGEPEAIVVAAASPFRTIGDFLKAFKDNPGALAVAGGSTGGADQITAALLAEAVGADPRAVDYVAFSGGGEVLAAILAGEAAAGISGAGDFAKEVAAGRLRLLAVTGERRAGGIDAPTLKEAGVDVTMRNWRMVAAAPGLDEAQVARIAADVKAMAASASWKEALRRNGWDDAYLDGDAFRAELTRTMAETQRVLIGIGTLQP
ncbi:Bug family tripartite tricarboxylate transporter substrate binding protein [Aureimonas leprariae]|nr:tripartite tricarboxylate transporter substrate-binding protein [Aureimonas leprariae]